MPKAALIPFPTRKPEIIEPYCGEWEAADLNQILTGGIEGCTLHVLEEGMRLDDPDGNTIWRIFRATN